MARAARIAHTLLHCEHSDIVTVINKHQRIFERDRETENKEREKEIERERKRESYIIFLSLNFFLQNT